MSGELNLATPTPLVVEGKVIGFESLGGTEGTGAAGFMRGVARGWVRSLGVVTWRSLPNWFDPCIQWGISSG